MLFGHNSRLPNADEIQEALTTISEYVSAATGLDFDAANARASIAHFAKDIQLGETGTYAAINQLARLKLSGLVKHLVSDTTLYFKNKSREIRIYPKLQEVLASGKATPEAIAAARGNLRFEYCLLNKYGVESHAERLGLPDSKTEGLLTQTVSDSLLLSFFDDIGFPDLLFNSESNIDLLEEHFSSGKAMRLAGFLDFVTRHGENCYKDSTLRIKKATYYRNVIDCRKAGVWKAVRVPE